MKQLSKDDVRDGGEDDVDVLAVGGARVMDVGGVRVLAGLHELKLDEVKSLFVVGLKGKQRLSKSQ